ncbi:DUF4232 domain-containing protein [Streptomyces sp. NPDC057854]|uniref:DUF4232 domain-containing protein n=1 Tax=unclassified Streptomyces TaxID=2593676 RepID=UPI0036B16684
MRTTARRLALPAAALAATLALTACQSSGEKTAAAPTTTPTPTAPSTAPSTPTAPQTTAPGATTATPATPAATKPPVTTAPPATPSQKSPEKAQDGKAQDGKAPNGNAQDENTPLRPCTAAGVKVVASKVSRPLNHLALTVTNTGARSCNAAGAPLVGFDHSQAPIRIVEESKPQAVVTLAPGESAYASLILTGEPGGDTHGTTVRTIKVNLTPDSMVTVAAPEGTYVDDGAAVSYWQREFEDALQY